MLAGVIISEARARWADQLAGGDCLVSALAVHMRAAVNFRARMGTRSISEGKSQVVAQHNLGVLAYSDNIPF